MLLIDMGWDLNKKDKSYWDGLLIPDIYDYNDIM